MLRYIMLIVFCYFFRTKTRIMEIEASKGNPYGNPWTKLNHKS